MVAKASISRIVFPLIECKLNSALPCSFHSRASLVAKSLMSKEVDMTEDEKKEVLSSDEKGAAKSTLGGAVAGAVVGTVVGTPVVGTLIGAVSGAVMAARKRRSKPTKRRTKAKTSPEKKRAPAKAAAKKS